MNFKNTHLIISSTILIPAALLYGFQPNLIFDVKPNSLNESNIFKAIMGLYFGFSVLWIYGILKPSVWETATISNIIFMFGLVFGRIISILFDGIPTTIFVIGTIGELVLGLFSLYQLKNKKSFD